MIYSVTLYKNKKNKIIILPNAQDETGLGRSVNQAIVVDVPYNMALLGQKTKEAFDISVMNTPYSGPYEDVLGRVSGMTNWSRFVKEWLSVWASMNDETKTYRFLPGKRERGGYSTVKGNEELYLLPIMASNEEIGALILNAFENSI